MSRCRRLFSPLSWRLPISRSIVVQLADLAQRLGRGLRLGALRFEERPPRVGPALGVRHADLLRVARVGLVAVAEQHRAAWLLEPQRLLHVLVPTRLEEREAHFVVLAVDRPEVRRLHLARPGAPGFDGRLVHRLDAAGTDRGELGLVDGLEQLRALLYELGQPRPAELEARRDEPLVLAVQRKVPRELVDQQPGDEAHIGAAALDDAHRRRRTVQRLRLPQLDQRAHVLEHDIAARALRQAVAGLLADDLVVLGAEVLHFGVGHLDRDHRHLGRRRRTARSHRRR